MTNKELLYIEDALGHECFMKSCSNKTSGKLQDVNLSNYMKELEQKHTELFNKFLNLLQVAISQITETLNKIFDYYNLYKEEIWKTKI